MRLHFVRLVVALLGLIGVLLLPGAVVGPGGQAVGYDEMVTTQVPVEQSAGGYRVYIDPVTGRFIEQPAGPVSEPSLELMEKVSTSHDGLVVTQSPLPGGGYKLDLGGRFQNFHKATVSADGKLQVECHAGLPTSQNTDRKDETNRSNDTKE